jgi:hypothetical protein
MTNDEGWEDAGRRLAAAMISYKSGLSFQTVYKKITAHGRIGRSWVLAAEWIQRAMAGDKQPPLVWGQELRQTADDETAQESNEIVNRHLIAMMNELHDAGFKMDSAVAFVQGAPNTPNNFTTLLGPSVLSGVSEGEARYALVSHANAAICDLLDKLEENVPAKEQN